jgi:1-acyl-sn-glycerol-3-phosphate acyltransferase
MMANKKPDPYNWFYGNPPFMGILYRFTTFVFRLLGATLFRFRLEGLDKVPLKEPILLLPNHSTMLDPFLVGPPVMRGTKQMASAGLLRVPYLGALLKNLGSFPKMKYTKDKNSMQTLQDKYDEGYAVLLFPEGNRCWNGETSPVGDGIGRLIKRMGATVVYARMNSAFLFQPRWAKYPRWVPIEITYDGPYRYDEDQTAEEIAQDVQSKLMVSAHLKKPAWTWGFRMAHGLRQYLWACPACFTFEALHPSKKDGNTIVCSSCAAAWTLNIENIMQGTNTFPVTKAFDKLNEHFGCPPVADRHAFEETGVALKAEYGKLLFLPRGSKIRQIEAEGRFEIHTDGLRIIRDDGSQWSSTFSEMTGISVEIASLLHFRIGDKLFRVVTPNHSPLKWDHFLRLWRQHSVGAKL